MPEKTKSVDLKVKIILSDEIPVKQRPKQSAIEQKALLKSKFRNGFIKALYRKLLELSCAHSFRQKEE